MDAPNSQFVSSQDIVTPDIETLYDKIIKDIDSFRSRCNGLEISTPIKSLDDVLFNSSISLEYQESRCHAFYRMMGFPVISADGSDLYSPGFDPDLNKDKDRIKKVLKIANSLFTGPIKSILNAREIYSKNSTNAFQIKDNNNAVLGLASVSPRPFDKQLKPNVEPLEVDAQSFQVPNRELASGYFLDVSAPTESSHILKPFIVDPRIEFSVLPAGNRICAPFLLDKSKTQLSPNNYLRRPYIERVIRVRYGTKNIALESSEQSEINKFIDDLVESIKQNSDVISPDLVEITSDTFHKLHKSELIVVGKFLKIIEALVGTLVDSIKDIERVQSDINWKPLCENGGPEFGIELNTIDPNDTINNKKIEIDILDQQRKKYISEVNLDIGISQPDLGNFTFSNIDDIVFGSMKNVSQFHDEQLGILENRRNELGNKANSLLKNIEVITGEFSGLGLLDIMAIQAAFWIMEPEALVGLIDNEAIGRMQSDQNLQGTLGGFKPIDALKEFEKKISEIYVLIQAFYAEALAGGTNIKQ